MFMQKCDSRIENKRVENFSYLLPHIAGIIETLNGATLTDVHRQVETDLDLQLSAACIAEALESGIKLGVFKASREFKVNKEFRTRELKKFKDVEDQFLPSRKGYALSRDLPQMMSKTLVDFVKQRRNERKRKMEEKYKRLRTYTSKKASCENCYKRVRRNIGKNSKKQQEKKRGASKKNKKQPPRTRKSGKAYNTNKVIVKEEPTKEEKQHQKQQSHQPHQGKQPQEPQPLQTPPPPQQPPPPPPPQPQQQEQQQQQPEKSRLLVRKNPLETEPPYYDIFT